MNKRTLLILLQIVVAPSILILVGALRRLEGHDGRYFLWGGIALFFVGILTAWYAANRERPQS
jgi:hypothetical protein